MSKPAPRPQRSSTQSPAATVRITTNRVAVPSGGSFAGARGPHHATTHNWYAWIVMALLITSTTLALYDLYLLMRVLAGGA
jgi:hypothetical protein